MKAAQILCLILVGITCIEALDVFYASPLDVTQLENQFINSPTWPFASTSFSVYAPLVRAPANNRDMCNLNGRDELRGRAVLVDAFGCSSAQKIENCLLVGCATLINNEQNFRVAGSAGLFRPNTALPEGSNSLPVVSVGGQYSANLIDLLDSQERDAVFVLVTSG